MYYRRQGKVPSITVFYKLLLSDINDKILVILMTKFLAFFLFFLDVPTVAVLCSSPVLNFQMLSYQQKLSFYAAFGRISGPNSPKAAYIFDQ